MLRSLFLSAGLVSVLGLASQTLSIQMSGIRSDKGTIRLQVFTSAQNFDKSSPLLVKTYAKSGLSGGQLKLELDGLKPGTYGIAVLDDENNNQKMDYGLVMPKEGFGFSDYYHTGMSRPVFSQFDFQLGQEHKRIEIRMRYL
jgi:uncharacterized protein (DUF2141 family)